MANEKMIQNALVEASHLKKYFKVTGRGMLHAVDDVSFQIYPGETLGLVGESGCGKSTVGNLIMQLHKATDGTFIYRGQNVFEAKRKEKLDLKKKIQIIFQDPYSSLNPQQTIETILSQPYIIHHLASDSEDLKKKVRDLCDQVGISHDLLNHFPHELDGGMRQVVGIARALSLNPDFIVCDEPVSSLDVSIQAKIINLLMKLQAQYGISYLFISHDLSVVRHISNRIAVMYLGQIVETATTDSIFENTMHPYSIALLSAVPRVNVDEKVQRIVLEGDVPSPMNPKPGCRFAPRCWMCDGSRCCNEAPELREVAPDHFVACHYAEESHERAAQHLTTHE